MRPTGPVISFLDADGRPLAVAVDNPLPIGGGGNGGGGGGGVRFLAGEGAPSASDGMPGDIYLDTDSGDLYRNENGSWVELMSLVGPEGPAGTDGSDGADGADGAPGADGQDAEITPAATVDPASETFPEDLIAALQTVGLMESP